jgi:hypothetical protein
MTQELKFRCFHCDEVFTGDAAALHFGTKEHSMPACQIDIDEYRKMEQEVAEWRAECSPLQREISSMTAAHAVEIRRAEETGYAKGLADRSLVLTYEEESVPSKAGVYACRVPDKQVSLLLDRFLVWYQGSWYYPSSDQRFRGEVKGWIGPLPRNKVRG